MTDLSRVTRVEVIDGMGRTYTSFNADEVSISVQDDGRTLKVMHTGDTSHGMSSKHREALILDMADEHEMIFRKDDDHAS